MPPVHGDRSARRCDGPVEERTALVAAEAARSLGVDHASGDERRAVIFAMPRGRGQAANWSASAGTVASVSTEWTIAHSLNAGHVIEERTYTSVRVDGDRLDYAKARCSCGWYAKSIRMDRPGWQEVLSDQVEAHAATIS